MARSPRKYSQVLVEDHNITASTKQYDILFEGVVPEDMTVVGLHFHAKSHLDDTDLADNVRGFYILGTYQNSVTELQMDTAQVVAATSDPFQSSGNRDEFNNMGRNLWWIEPFFAVNGSTSTNIIEPRTSRSLKKGQTFVVMRYEENPDGDTHNIQTAATLTLFAVT